MAPRKIFNPVEFYRKAASTKPLSVAAPKTKFRPPPTAQLSTIGHLFDKAAPLIADYITAGREKEIRSADETNAMKMIKALTAPQATYDPEKYGTSPEELRAAAEGYDGYDDEQILSDEAQREFYTEEANRVEAAYNQGDPYGAARVRQQANLGAYDMPDQTSGLAKLFGAEPQKGRMGDRSRDVMMQILLGDKTKKDAAELLAGERTYKKEVAEALAASKLAAARAKLTDDPTSNMRDFKELQRLQVKYPPINGKESPEVATFKDFVRATKYKDTGRAFVQMRPGEPPIPSIKKQVPIEKTPEHVGSVAQAKKAGALVGEKNSKDFFQARDVIGNVKDIDDLTSRLQAVDGSALGFLAELKQQRDRVFALFGSKEALAKVSDVELVDALMGAEVFALIKVLGIGARGLDTPAERKFLRQVLTGDINLTKRTLLEMASKRRRIQVRKVENWNKRLAAGDYDNFYTNNDYLKRPLSVPGPAPIHTPIDITGSINTMTVIQLNEKLNSGATADERRQIGLRLDALGHD